MLDPCPGLDLGSLAGFLDRHVDGLAGELHGEILSGGLSHLTYSVTDGERRWVVRRPPLGPISRIAHDMSKEWRVISALQETGVPVPQAIAYCADVAVIGAPFYITGFVDGHVVRDRLPRVYPRTATTRASMSAALVDAMVHLHAVDIELVGLSGLGQPDGFLDSQLRAWWQRWEASKARELPAIEELHRRLERSIPMPTPRGVVHGDFRLDNLVFAPDDPSRVAAILDWELTTVGDPLCDLGQFIVQWPDRADDPVVMALHAGGLSLDDGFYSQATLIHEYHTGSDRDLSNLDWYVAIGSFKLVILAETINRRRRIGGAAGERFETMEEVVPLIVEAALDRAGRSAIPGLRG